MSGRKKAYITGSEVRHQKLPRLVPILRHTEMSTGQVLDCLAQWKSRKFRNTEISLTRAVSSLSTNKPKVEAKPGRLLSRWIVSIHSPRHLIYDRMFQVK